MLDTVIRVNNLGKKYIIGHQKQERYTALRDVLTNGAVSLKSKVFKPFVKLSDPTVEEFWALKDVSFEIKQGDRVGIIGRNGAGKSTLLKILSRITEPTNGRICVKGRVASLLEVGTGFHPELTGRENIYLNGAILGMSKAEIKRKFDEIVAFAEVEKFLDTPVKRYSSGMYVRLAFAVAAHLEPEILIVDEVLAVGDAQFQKKCLGKMDDVATREGRTVLFVSHNMGAIIQLCKKTILLENGVLRTFSETSDSISTYLKVNKNNENFNLKSFDGTLKKNIKFEQIQINNYSKHEEIVVSPLSKIFIRIKGECKEDIPNFRITFSIFKAEIRMLTMHDVVEPELLPKGNFQSEIEIANLLLRPGDYSVAIGGYRDGMNEWIWGTDLITFTVAEEWSYNYDPLSIGLINLPHNGRRHTYI